MDYVLVNLDTNWADEFNVNCMWLTTSEKYEEFISKLESLEIDNEIEIYFGTNEAISFYGIDDIINSIKISPISDEFYNEFLKIFGTNVYGLIDIPCILEGLSEDYDSESVIETADEPRLFESINFDSID